MAQNENEQPDMMNEYSFVCEWSIRGLQEAVRYELSLGYKLIGSPFVFKA